MALNCGTRCIFEWIEFYWYFHSLNTYLVNQIFYLMQCFGNVIAWTFYSHIIFRLCVCVCVCLCVCVCVRHIFLPACYNPCYQFSASSGDPLLPWFCCISEFAGQGGLGRHRSFISRGTHKRLWPHQDLQISSVLGHLQVSLLIYVHAPFFQSVATSNLRCCQGRRDMIWAHRNPSPHAQEPFFLPSILHVWFSKNYATDQMHFAP